jgi:Kae1-associated kinase Bud32
MSIIAQGAEAIITLITHDGKQAVLKDRPVKRYRHPILDKNLRTSRTRKELKVLTQAQALGIPVPSILTSTNTSITMSFIPGEQLREMIDTNPTHAKNIGSYLSTLHEANIIHADLTTSNVIVRPDNTLVLIDFGLSITSTRIEDKAVDLHIFKQSLESKHHNISTKAWELFLEGYQPKDRTNILERLRIVEKRGRNKG